MKRLIRSWDASLSVLAGIIFWILLASSDRELVDTKPYLGVAISFGSAIGIAWLVASRWLTDLLGKEDYGELLRTFDKDLEMAQRPYYVVVSAAWLLALGSILLIVSYENLPRPVLDVCYSVLFSLAIYTILGSFSLASIHRRHTSRASRIRELKERSAREARLRPRRDDAS